MALEFVTRGMVEDDRNFIYSSYLKSLRKNHPWIWVPHRLYFTPQAAVLESILSYAECVVACYPEAPDEIIGYVLFQHLPEVFVLHYLLSRQPRLGIGRGLFDAAAGSKQMVVTTHMCDGYEKLRSKIAPRRVVYDPYLLEKLRNVA